MDSLSLSLTNAFVVCGFSTNRNFFPIYNIEMGLRLWADSRGRRAAPRFACKCALPDGCAQRGQNLLVTKYSRLFSYSTKNNGFTVKKIFGTALTAYHIEAALRLAETIKILLLVLAR